MMGVMLRWFTASIVPLSGDVDKKHLRLCEVFRSLIDDLSLDDCDVLVVFYDDYERSWIRVCLDTSLGRQFVFMDSVWPASSKFLPECVSGPTNRRL